MKQAVIAQLHSQFEGYARIEDGIEFWLGRDLQVLLGYTEWRNFEQVIDRASAACANAGQRVEDHFVGAAKMVEIGSGTHRQVHDVAMTRYACYLVAQNGDPRKDAIAFAQTYFAVQTRKQELIEQRLMDVERLQAREKLTLSEKALNDVIFERLGDGHSFARIRSKGDEALFGGHTTQQMKDQLDVPTGRPLADFLPTITIKAKDFANEITTFNVRKEPLDTEPSIAQEHVRNNDGVRSLLIERGIVPESLPAAEDVRKLERRVKAEQKRLSKGKPAS